MGRLTFVAVAVTVVAQGSSPVVMEQRAVVAQGFSPANRLHVTSPNGSIVLDLSRDSNRHLAYSVSLGGALAIEPSRAGIVVDGKDLGDGVDIGRAEPYAVDETYAWNGVHATAVNRCRGSRVSLTTSGTPWSIDVRACDDGAAFRFVVPGDAHAARTPDESTTFRLPAGSIVWTHDFEGHYEGMHEQRVSAKLNAWEWAAPPLTARLPGGAGYAAITESALAGYSGMALQADGRGAFRARLAHEAPIAYPFFLRYSPGDITRLSKAAEVAGTITTPWRLVIAARTLNALVNADLVHNLAAPPDPALFPGGTKTTWVRPGRAVWRFLDGGDNSFEGMKAFTRLGQQLGFEYHVVEGLWQRWSDGELREFMADAKARGIGIWLWKDSRALATVAQQRAFFDLCQTIGVAGAKIDFFDHESKEMIDRYQSILRESAARQIMVNFHGANKPAGEARTWPHELTREGVYGLEHRGAPAWAQHNATLPFTRYLAGAGDYTPMVFGERRKDTSWAHQIATAVVFTSPLLVFGGHPQSLLDNPAVALIKSLPAVWDETIVLPGSEVGELAAFARRSGRAWFVGMLNGPTARTVKVDLGFLGGGRYNALVVTDKAEDSAAVTVEPISVSRATPLTIALRAGGGFAARFTQQ